MSGSSRSIIQGPFYSLPAQQPGTVVLTFQNGRATKVESKQSHLREQTEELATPQLIVAGVVLLLVFLFLFGFLYGIALSVLAAAGGLGYLLFNRNSDVSVFFLGTPKEYYLVDTARRAVSDSRRAQLQDPGIYAIVDFEYRVSPQDPVKVIEYGILDVRDYLSDKFYPYIDGIVNRGTLDDKLRSLRDELFAFFNSRFSDDVFIIESAAYDVRLEGVTAEQLSKLSSASLRKQGLQVQGEIERVERDTYREIIGDDQALLAEMMRAGSDKERVNKLVQLRMERQDISFNQNLEIFKTALENGVLEAHQISRDYPDFFRALTASLGGLVAKPIEKAVIQSEEDQDRQKLIGGDDSSTERE